MPIVELDILSFTLNIDEASYCWSLSANLGSLDSFTHVAPGTIIDIVVGSQTFKIKVDSRERVVQWGSENYSFTGRSLTSILGKDAIPIYKTWNNTISAYNAILEIIEIAGCGPYIESPSGPLPNSDEILVEYNLIDWIFPPNVLSSEGETPIELIQRIVIAGGGIITTTFDGTLLINHKYKIDPPLYSLTLVDTSLSDTDEIVSLAESGEIKPKYGKVYVSNIPDSDISSVSIEEIEKDMENFIATIRASIFPFVDDFELFHSYDSTVTIDKNSANPINEIVVDELIEIVDGFGNASKLIFSMDNSSIEYFKTDLGTVSFEGTTVTTEILGNTLLQVSYTTQYHDFTVNTDSYKKIQIYTGEI